MGEVWAIVVAGGSASRFGGAVPKQFLELGGLRLLDWSLAAAGAVCDGVVAVLPAAHLDAVPALNGGGGDPGAPPGRPAGHATAAGADTAARTGGDPAVVPGGPAGHATAAGAGTAARTGGDPAVVPGGATRSASVRSGLAAVPPEAEIVVVHDAARPLATAELFERVVTAVRAGADGAVPGLPVPDTIKRVDASGDQVIETLDRPSLRAIQTPQAFSAAALRAAHAGGAHATDDAALVEAAGGRVVVVDGDPANLKITGPDDLVRAELLLTRRSL